MRFIDKLKWRRSFIVDWRLQVAMAWRAIGLVVCTLMVVSAGLIIPLLDDLHPVAREGSLLEAPAVMLYLNDRFWWLALTCIGLASAGAILVSHRIAGPLVRIRRNLRWLGEGKLPAPLRTRSRDFLQSEVATLNQTVAMIGQQVESMRATHAGLSSTLAAGAAALRNGDAAAATHQLQSAFAAVDDLGRQLATFVAMAPADELPATIAAVPVEAAAGA
jgi:signal transduction histidine kinase